MLTETQELAPDGKPWQIFTLSNSQGMQVKFMDWGATWLSATLTLTDNSRREALLGCATPADYLRQSAYLGATVGRYANRINQARLTQGEIALAANQAPHQLHGGPEGFSHRRWQLRALGAQNVSLRLDSADGDQGFPGNLRVDQHIELRDDNSLRLIFELTSDAATPVALTNHAYFNLDAEQGDARQHWLQINADKVQPVDAEGIPNAPLLAVTETGFDFRQPKQIASDFLRDSQQQVTHGYDHAFLINPGDENQPAATLSSADQRLTVQISSSEPVIQCYSANFLAGTPGRSGDYQNYQGIALEPGYLPDSPNHPQWPQPSCWLAPGEKRKIVINYQFLCN